MPVLLAYVLFLVAGLAYVAHSTSGRRRLGRVATVAMTLAWALLLITLVARGILAGHWPLSTHYEFALCFIWLIAGIYLFLERRWCERRAGVFAALILWFLTAYAVAAPASTKALGPLPPALQSPWLQAHVISVMVGYGAFAVAAALSLARLAYSRKMDSDPADRGPVWLPPVVETERMMGRLIAVGFPWLTAGLLTGAIWAQKAWGRYWGWDPKETWALVSWLWFLLVLHVAPQPRWQGRRLAWLTLIGFGLILFTFIGVPRLSAILRLSTLHGY